MGKELFSNNEQQFVKDAIAQSLRVDGRSCNDIRPVKIQLGPELGQAHVQLGKSRLTSLILEFMHQ
jgi:exosome complex component RRP45